MFLTCHLASRRSPETTGISLSFYNNWIRGISADCSLFDCHAVFFIEGKYYFKSFCSEGFDAGYHLYTSTVCISLEGKRDTLYNHYRQPIKTDGLYVASNNAHFRSVAIQLLKTIIPSHAPASQVSPRRFLNDLFLKILVECEKTEMELPFRPNSHRHHIFLNTSHLFSTADLHRVLRKGLRVVLIVFTETHVL